MKERRLRYQCLLKGSNWQNVRGVYNGAVKGISRSIPVQVSLDIDPVSMM
jgi:primosomal protein N' (replication factor Y)